MSYTWVASWVGIFVKSDTTSKNTRSSSSSTVCEVMNLTKSKELRTWCSVFPTRGDRISTRCLERAYVGEVMKETIGLRGTSGLWILGIGRKVRVCDRLSYVVCCTGSWRGGLIFVSLEGGSSSFS